MILIGGNNSKPLKNGFDGKNSDKDERVICKLLGVK